MANKSSNQSKPLDNKGEIDYDNQKSPISQSYELFILAFSIISIVNILILLLPTKTAVNEAINIINLFLSIIFMADFFYRLNNAKSKSYYFFKDLGWLDLLGSIPFGIARLFRIFRVFRAVKTIRKFGFRNMFEEFQNNKAQSAMMTVLVFIVIVLEIGSSLVVIFESKNPNANIVTGGDALWYAIVTVTTVGYGDRFPITPEGRLTGLFIMIAGVGLFGIFTGFLANTFLTPRKRKKDENKESIKTQIAKIRESLDDLEKSIEQE